MKNKNFFIRFFLASKLICRNKLFFHVAHTHTQKKNVPNFLNKSFFFSESLFYISQFPSSPSGRMQKFSAVSECVRRRERNLQLLFLFIYPSSSPISLFFLFSFFAFSLLCERQCKKAEEYYKKENVNYLNTFFSPFSFT